MPDVVSGARKGPRQGGCCSGARPLRWRRPTGVAALRLQVKLRSISQVCQISATNACNYFKGKVADDVLPFAFGSHSCFRI